MDVVARRYSFYEMDGLPLRYAESDPPSAYADHAGCGCTSNVANKPDGLPDQVNTGVEFKTRVGEIDVHISLREGIQFLFVWALPEPYLDWCKKVETRGRAVFHFSGDRLHIEVDGQDFGITNCHLGDVFFGAAVDTSRLLNGGSPSKAEGLAELRPGDVWVYGGHGKREKIDRLRHKEAAVWTALRCDVLATLAAIAIDATTPVSEIGRRARGEWVRERLETAIKYLLVVATQPLTFDLVRRLVRVNAETGIADLEDRPGDPKECSLWHDWRRDLTSVLEVEIDGLSLLG